MTDIPSSAAGPYGVHSEVGRLRKVLVCAPGLAHERLTPSNCDDLLFDDVIWVQNARRDHFDFVSKMRERGVEVLARLSRAGPRAHRCPRIPDAAASEHALHPRYHLLDLRRRDPQPAVLARAAR